MQNRTINWDRQKLYDELWSRPATAVAQSYGVSDSALKKICHKLSIPKPPVGYWVRKSHGHNDPRPPLPAVSQDIVHVTELRQQKEGTKLHLDGLPSLVPATATGRSQFVVDFERCFSRQKVDGYGRLLADDRGQSNGPFRVTAVGFPRGIAFLDALFKLADANGISLNYKIVKPTSYGQNPREFFAVCEGEKIQLRLTEAVKQAKKVLTRAQLEDRKLNPNRYYPPREDVEYKPTNKFTFELISYSDGPREWHDRKDRSIEDCLPEIIQSLRVAAKYAKQQRSERQIAENLRRVEERKKWIFDARVKRLEENMQRWELANRIRKYADALQAGLERAENISEKRISNCLAWMRSYANSMDQTLRPSLHEDWEEE